jgi:hypothetical protein
MCSSKEVFNISGMVMNKAEKKDSFDIEFEKIRLERFRIVCKVLTVFISVGIGTFGVAWINGQIQQQKITELADQNRAQIALQNLKTKAENQKEEMKYLGDYLKYALDDNVERRRRFAEYFAALTVSTELQDKWNKYKISIEELITKEADQEAELSIAVQTNDIIRAAELKRELAETKTRLRNISKDWKTALDPVSDETARNVILDILAMEGGFADYPGDPLGATNYGISLQTLRRVYGSDLTNDDLRALTTENAISYYYKNVFLYYKLNLLPQPLWLPMLDAVVSNGSRRSIKWLQSVCVDENVKVRGDGIIGKSTIDCAEGLNESIGVKLIPKLVEKRLGFLKKLDSWKTFGRGWERRVLRLLPEKDEG